MFQFTKINNLFGRVTDWKNHARWQSYISHLFWNFPVCYLYWFHNQYHYLLNAKYNSFNLIKIEIWPMLSKMICLLYCIVRISESLALLDSIESSRTLTKSISLLIPYTKTLLQFATLINENSMALVLPNL